MTRPKVDNDLLILPPSASRWPVASVAFARSEPARSTRRIRAHRSIVSSEVMSCWICLSITVKTACDRDEVSFIFVDAVVRF